MTERQWTMLHEPVHCAGFPIFRFLQVVKVPEEYRPSQSMTPSVTIKAQNLQHSITDA
jgi:hypothetical protein